MTCHCHLTLADVPIYSVCCTGCGGCRLQLHRSISWLNKWPPLQIWNRWLAETFPKQVTSRSSFPKTLVKILNKFWLLINLFSSRSNMTYLTDYKSWAKCSEPKNVVLFNTALFMTLLIASCLQGLLCAMQIINGLAGTLFGTCDKKEVR